MTETLPEGVTACTKYVALDGTEWDSPGSAAVRNADQARYTKANSMLESGHTVWDCWNLIYPIKHEQYDVLKRVNKDTGLIIAHWQCCDRPVYSVQRFDIDKGVYVWGAGQGREGSGLFHPFGRNPYGQHMSLIALVGYAKDTFFRLYYPGEPPECSPPTGSNVA